MRSATKASFLFAALSISIAALAGCASNTDDAGDTSADAVTASSSVGITVRGTNGGRIFKTMHEVTTAFGYDPTKPRVTDNDLKLSDDNGAVT